jgi:uncharacterized iron-regulated membrane protein
MAKKIHFTVRRLHRYMGVILGIQFFFWTVGGLYFSWSNMDEIHGDFQKAHILPLSVKMNLTNPQTIIQKIKQKDTINFILDIRLIQILQKPVYQIIYSKQPNGAKKIQLADAQTAELRPVISEREAIEIAQNNFSDKAKVKKIEYLTSTDSHHEYREQPLPAFAVTFEHHSNTTVYVASEFGTVQRFRNDKWRIFDFLWMMHTMDYQSRDNLSNWLLRAFSIFGLLTILSGFALFWVSRKRKTIK